MIQKIDKIDCIPALQLYSNSLTEDVPWHHLQVSIFNKDSVTPGSDKTKPKKPNGEKKSLEPYDQWMQPEDVLKIP